MTDKTESESVMAARRKFLASCGKFAVVTPPAVTLLLSSAHQNFAVASSGGLHRRRHKHKHKHHGHHRGHKRGGWHANNGFGNGGRDGVPGRSGKSDVDR